MEYEYTPILSLRCHRITQLRYVRLLRFRILPPP